MESQVDVSTPNSELPTAPVGDRGTRADMPFRWPHTGRVKHTYYVARERRRPIFIMHNHMPIYVVIYCRL